MSITFYAGVEAKPNSFTFLDSVESINLSNSNAREVIEALGYACDYGMEPVTNAELLARCTALLRNRLGRPSAAVPTVETVGARGARFIDCGRDAAYIETTVRRIMDLVRAGAEAGSTHVYAA